MVEVAMPKLLGGHLCLDFANTANWHAASQPEEHLTSYQVLVAWSVRAGILAGDEAARLLGEAERRPQEAEAVLRRAIGLREAIYRLFTALAHGRSPAGSDLAELNAALAAAWPHLHLVREGDRFTWAWMGGSEDLGRMLWPLACSAAELLTSGDLSRVRQCAGDPCGWLFFDTSRNRSRRWCAMEDCGNRAKARRHYRRRKAEGT